MFYIMKPGQNVWALVETCQTFSQAQITIKMMSNPGEFIVMTEAHETNQYGVRKDAPRYNFVNETEVDGE